ncbi:leucine-rich repeat protein [Hoylesella loescheii]|nr:leucine-rich repeat protein [Hoylesella loescheii]
MMMRSDLDRLCVEGVNYSVQPNNEIWYTTIDNNKADAVAMLNNYGGDRDIKILEHVFENGLWKVKADRPIVYIPEHYIRFAPNIVSISIPNRVITLSAWSMGLERYPQGTPNLRTVILSSVPKLFNSQFQPFQCGDLDIYVPKEGLEEFTSLKIISKTPSNRVHEWGNPELQLNIVDPYARQTLERLYNGKMSMANVLRITVLNNTFNNSLQLRTFEELKYFTSVTSMYRTFYGCKNLTGTMTIPSSVMTVNGTTFYQTQLVGIEFLAQNFKWGHGMVWACPKLEWIKMHSKEVPQKITANDQYPFDFAINNNTWKLYVPDQSVDKYKADHNFKNLGERIRPMSEFNN